MPVSKFPIHEYVPEIAVPLEKVEDISKAYNAELERHKQFRGFGYFRNRSHWEGSTRGLVFQGSYLNKANSKFLKYALGEYIFVHDYQNILELPYYLPVEEISVQQGTALTKMIWKNAPTGIEYAWCVMGDEYDMRPSTEGGYEVTVKNEVWQTYQNEMQIVTMDNGKFQLYNIK